MSENENLSPKTQLENLAKKLETPQITLLQIKNLQSEQKKIIDGIKMRQVESPLTKEEIEAVNKVIEEFNQKSEAKILSFVDQWEAKEFTPNDREVEFLQSTLIDIWGNKSGLREAKENERYQKDKNFTERVDKFKQDKAFYISYHDKLLFLISQYYKDQQNSSTSSDQKKNPTVLPWTLAIIFGIMTVILAGIAGFLFYKQRKMKRFKV